MVTSSKQLRVTIYGSIRIRTLDERALGQIDRVRATGAVVLVSDAPGADSLVQQELHRAGYRDVVVYHNGARGGRPRNNVGDWPEVHVPGTHTAKDRAMCAAADYGLAFWDGRSPGTRRNNEQLRGRVRVVLSR